MPAYINVRSQKECIGIIVIGLTELFCDVCKQGVFRRHFTSQAIEMAVPFFIEGEDAQENQNYHYLQQQQQQQHLQPQDLFRDAEYHEAAITEVMSVCCACAEDGDDVN